MGTLGGKARPNGASVTSLKLAVNIVHSTKRPSVYRGGELEIELSPNALVRNVSSLDGELGAFSIRRDGRTAIVGGDPSFQNMLVSGRLTLRPACRLQCTKESQRSGIFPNGRCGSIWVVGEHGFSRVAAVLHVD